MKKIPLHTVFLLGVNSILSQVILIRELLVNFSGNEISIGIVLVTWLVGGAIGAAILAKPIIRRFRDCEGLFFTALSLISISTPAVIFLSRAARPLFKIPIYEMIGPIEMLCICAFILIPIAALLSFTFILCCETLKKSVAAARAPGHAYILEALGAAFGGLVFTFILAGHLNSFQIAFILMAINFLCLFWLSIGVRKNRCIAAGLLGLSLSSLALGMPAILEKKSQSLQWQPQQVIAYEHSPYGNISVTRAGGSLNLYQNGSIFFTTEDEAFNEEFVHLILLQHKRPGRILLIGSGIGGALKEMLKHNPDNITYLELDPLAIEIGRKIISSGNSAALNDSRVNILHRDGRFFLKRTKQKFDIIIVNLPNPTTLQLNRFYTKEFYQDARLCLKKGGIFATGISSKESIISDGLAQYNASIYNTLGSVFRHINFIPGERLIYITSDNHDIMLGRPDILLKRFKGRGITTRFFTPYHIKFKYYPYIRAYFKRRLAAQIGTAKLNTDFRPICFYYDAVLWAARFNPAWAVLLKLATGINIFNSSLIILAFFAISLCIIKKKKDPWLYAVPSTIAISGITGISAEIILMLLFQIRYGYVYEKVGLLIALFMLGLASGAYLANKQLLRVKNHGRLLAHIVLAFLVYILSVPAIMKALPAVSAENTQFIFYVMIILCGVMVGGQFPVAAAILQRHNPLSHSASTVWAADLFGAAAGTLLTSLILLPVLGMAKTAYLCAMLNAASLVLLILSRRRLPR